MNKYGRFLVERLSEFNQKATPFDRLRRASLEGVESTEGCTTLAYFLFMLIREHHGEAVARRIFSKWSKPPSAAQMRKIHNWALLNRVDITKPWNEKAGHGNVQKAAREIAEANRELKPRDRNPGPTGSTSESNIIRHIRRLLARRSGKHRKIKESHKRVAARAGGDISPGKMSRTNQLLK